jgi:NAD(P)H-flavin reductase
MFMTPEIYEVLESFSELPGVSTLTVQSQASTNEHCFAPGQFYMLYVFGVGEVPISVSGNPSNRDSLTFTVMEVGKVTSGICALKKGDRLGLRGPCGSPWPMQQCKDKHVLVLAGGLGLAPLRPVLFNLMEQPETFQSSTLLYGAREPGLIPFKQQLKEWHTHPHLRTRVTVDIATEEWDHDVGFVTELLDSSYPKDTVALICGPEAMMRHTCFKLLDAGLSAQDIFVSMERNMKCALGMCGRCQFGRYFVCKDGPVLPFSRLEHLLKIPEI